MYRVGMEEPTKKRSHGSQGKIDAITELELIFPKVPIPTFEGDCKGMPTNWWFPDHGISYQDTQILERARAVCNTCGVKEECLNFALEFPNLQGMWGGMSPKQRQNERRRRRYRASKTVKAK